MCVNYSMVKTIRPTTTDGQIVIYEPIADSIDTCLANYDESMQELTKALLVAFYVEQSESKGQLASEKTRTGASASYKTLTGQGLSSNRFGQQLQTLPTYGCVQSLVKSTRFAKSVMPCR